MGGRNTGGPPMRRDDWAASRTLVPSRPPVIARVHLRSLLATALGALVVAAGPAEANEGQWMPRQIPDLDAEAMRKAGLRLPLTDLHALDEAGHEIGILAATVNLSGCSAGFVSAQGLVATNHHCAYGAIQAASSVEHDYLKDGFVAADRAAEIIAKGATVQIVESVTDVTARVRAVADAQADPSARAQAVEALRKTMVAECEAPPPAPAPTRRCRVADFYAGAEVQLIASIELRDVRLVYAPPSAIGNYGGEIDNWMWPRHTGDFSLLRAYVGPDGAPAEYSTENIPYQPKRHLAVGTGVAPGDFVAVLGFPGTTQRYQSAAEVARHIDQVFPARIDLYGEWIAILEANAARDAGARIKVAAKLKGLQNRFKNSQGMLDGLRRNRTVERRRREDQELRAWIGAHPEGGSSKILDALDALSNERRDEFDRDFLIDNLTRGANSLAMAIDVVRRARERDKPDLQRVSEYMDRTAAELWSTQTRRVRDYDVAVDRALLGSLLRRVAALPATRRFVDAGEREVEGLLRSKLMDESFAKGLWEADWATIEDEDDPMIAFARALVPVLEEYERRGRARDGVLLGVGPGYFELLRAVRTGPVYPDANGTLRLSWGTVGGYSPREGLQATAQTTVTGMLEKSTGVEPFDVPTRVREAASRSTSSRWADPTLGDVPVGFLSNCDTTGGNSGSPVIDGQGRWVGLNFDRVWENVAGDFGYSPERSRNVVVDVRYLLWQLDEVEHAQWILDELGVTKAGAAAPTVAMPSEIGVPPQADPTPAITPTSRGCGCSTSPDSPAWVGLMVAMTAFGFRRRRSQRRHEALAETTASAS